jgi:cell division protein FtsL
VRAQIARSRTKTKRARKNKSRRRSLLWLTEAQAALGWAVLLALAAVLGAIYLHQTSGIAQVGRTVQGLQYQLEEVKRENSSLELNVAEAQSLERLRREAERLGFLPSTPDDSDYLIIHDLPALRESTETLEPQGEPIVIESAFEAIILSLKSRIGDFSRGEAK